MSMRHWIAALPLPLAAASLAFADAPRLRVLGTVQDGGLPHAGCSCERCEAAARDPNARRYVASLALIQPKEDEGHAIHLVDASPDLVAQLRLLDDLHTGPRGGVNRDPIDGFFLTHAHMGHYLGLAHVGYEAMHARELATYCTPRMASFLRENGPWSQLVEMRNIVLHEHHAGRSIDLPGGVRVTPIGVPHREEYSDTVAYRFQGPARTALYMPDCDPWARWESSIVDMLTDPEAPVDVFLVDGTFYSGDELPGRDLSKIGHPLIVDSMNLFQPFVDAGSIEIWFTHLNHTNPAIDPTSDAAREIDRRGFGVLREGQEIGL